MTVMITFIKVFNSIDAFDVKNEMITEELQLGDTRPGTTKPSPSEDAFGGTLAPLIIESTVAQSIPFF